MGVLGFSAFNDSGLVKSLAFLIVQFLERLQPYYRIKNARI